MQHSGVAPLTALLVTLLAASSAAGKIASKLPPYVTACSRSDPKLNECVLRNGRTAIPTIVNGDPKFRVPKMNPLVIPQLNLTQGTGSVGLKLSWKNAELHGLKDTDFQTADLSVEKRTLKLSFFMPRISITGLYSASGRVLLLPIIGTGPSNITVHRMKINYNIKWDIVKRSGREFIDVRDAKTDLQDIGFMSMRFENLFNGDAVLGPNMNQFLNENWKDLAKEFGPGVAEAIGEVFKLVLKNICDTVPYDLVLKP